MKKILIIDGGPRKKFTMGLLLEKFTDGAKSVSEEINVEHIRLYDIDFKGCISCMGCKLKGGVNYGRCVYKDGLSEVLDKIKTADGLAFASPIYYMSVTGEFHAAMERIMFPYLSYEGLPPKTRRVPTAMFYTMNVTPEQAVQFGLDKLVFDPMEMMIGMYWQKPERVCGYNTCQVRDYSRYDFHPTIPPSKEAWKKEHLPEEEQQAFDAGVRMAEKIMNETPSEEGAEANGHMF